MGIGPGGVGQQNKSPTLTNNRVPGFFPGH